MPLSLGGSWRRRRLAVPAGNRDYRAVTAAFRSSARLGAGTGTRTSQAGRYNSSRARPGRLGSAGLHNHPSHESESPPLSPAIIAAGELLGYDDVYRVTDLDLPARVTVTYHRRARTAGCDRDRDCQWPGILSQ